MSTAEQVLALQAVGASADLDYGVVTQVSPLLVRVGRASSAMPAAALRGYLPRVDDYVAVLVRGADRLVLGAVDAVAPLRIGCTATRSTAQSMGGSALTAISWTADPYDSDGFITPTSTTVTVPNDLGGVYAVSVSVIPAASITGYLRITIGGAYWQSQNGPFGDIAHSTTVPIAGGTSITASIWNSGAAVNISAARIDVYRVGP